MGVVVLIGFSCAGKSRILAPLKEQLNKEGRELPLLIDTDEKITEHDYPDGGIYSVFLDRTVADNTQPAMDYIVQREKEVLTELLTITPPAIVAAGPLILQRQPEWSQFLAKHKAKIIWLRLNPKRTVAGLKDREGRYQKRLHNGKPSSEHSSFGCWNKDILNTFDKETNLWRAMPDEQQIEAATKFMKFFGSTYYEKAADVVIDMNQVEPGNAHYEKLIATIKEALFD